MSAKLPLKKSVHKTIYCKRIILKIRACSILRKQMGHTWNHHAVDISARFCCATQWKETKKISNHDQHNSIQIDKILHDRDFPSVHKEFSLCETNSLPFFKSLSHKWKSFLPNFKVIRCEILDKPHLVKHRFPIRTFCNFSWSSLLLKGLL